MQVAMQQDGLFVVPEQAPRDSAAGPEDCGVTHAQTARRTNRKEAASPPAIASVGRMQLGDDGCEDVGRILVAAGQRHHRQGRLVIRPFYQQRRVVGCDQSHRAMATIVAQYGRAPLFITCALQKLEHGRTRSAAHRQQEACRGLDDVPFGHEPPFHQVGVERGRPNHGSFWGMFVEIKQF
jgi:hypothetical protein